MLLAARSAFLAQKKKLPFDSAVEYLESTGTQWIDTGVVPNGSLDIDITYSVSSLTTNNNIAFYGCVASDYGFFSGVAIPQGGTKAYYYINYITDAINGLTFNFSEQYRDWTNSTTYHHNEQNATVYAQTIMNHTMPIFARYHADRGIERIGVMRIYFVRLYSNSTLVRDFIPCRIGTTGYLYDKVSKQLFGNKGTGNFLYGKDVKVKL